MTSTAPPAWCGHGTGAHDGRVPSHASAPQASRAWLLITCDGRWAEEAVDTPLPGELGKLAVAADELGIRVQLIRRPARRARGAAGRVFAAWTAGPEPWLADVTSAAAVGDRGSDAAAVGDGGSDAPGGPDLAALAAGKRPASGIPVERMYLVCVHGRRDRCCARFGGPLARALSGDYPDEVWETTHVDGHRFAANVVLLPHGLYYGPCDLGAARAAIDAYRRGGVLARRYRGRAGQDAAAQGAHHAALARLGELKLETIHSA